MVNIDRDDSRWGDYIPWFYRSTGLPSTGNFFLFFDRVSQRVDRLFIYNEPGIPNMAHFGDTLETESYQRFRHDRNILLSRQIKQYFQSETIKMEFGQKIHHNQEVKKAYDAWQKLRAAANSLQFGKVVSDREKKLKRTNAEVNTAELSLKSIKEAQTPVVYMSIFNERLGVLEVLLGNLPPNGCVDRLVYDVRRFLAEAQIMLDIKGSPPLICPMEEPLLQREVIDNLLTRLSGQFPVHAKELVQCYHDLRNGNDLDTIFLAAFKSLEQIAREVASAPQLMFDHKNLTKHFPHLHPTIRESIIKLAAYRGDRGGHGKAAPSPHEMRYLLFSICNIALLLLEYPA